MTLRVVLDTNIVVSALIKRQGLEDLVFRLALSGHPRLYISPAILDEYARMLPKPKLKLTLAEVQLALGYIRRTGRMVRPAHVVSVCDDVGDNRFLECAETAAAHFLITGNLKHFPQLWKTTRIVSTRQFLEQVLARKL